ncbi:hypothetical protein Barb6XT_00469 [Bacteroidales bacterium Barb6XT]|nr:hypothetical protein Barb6XT_00469 [Bacteroidales bacterium Barb6XT]
MEATVVSRKKFKGNKQAVSSPSKEAKDEWSYTKEEFDAKLAHSAADFAAGRCKVMTTEMLKEMLDL